MKRTTLREEIEAASGYADLAKMTGQQRAAFIAGWLARAKAQDQRPPAPPAPPRR